MATEISTDDVTPEPVYQMQPSDDAPTLRCDGNRAVEDKLRATGRHETGTQRVRAVRIPTRIYPDILIPYLYGERGGRGMNAIVAATGCTIDYCALSPDELEQSPPSRGYVMSFLVSAGSTETLEDATNQLRILIEKVQVELQKKARQSTRYERGHGRDEWKWRDDMESKRRVMSHERWTKKGGPIVEVDNPFFSPWETPAMQRMSRKPHGFQERSRYPAGLETAGNKEFGMTQRHNRHSAKTRAAPLKSPYFQPRSQLPNEFFTHDRRYPEHPRWTPRYYPGQIRTEAGYSVHEDGENEEFQRSVRNFRHLPHIYHDTSKRFAKPGPNLYDYHKPRHENDANFSAYSETADLTNENAQPNEAPEFLEQYHQSMHRPHSRRVRKRPHSKMQRDGALPPTIHRQQIPYRYDYMFDNENNEWMAGDEEMDGGYGYPLHYRPVEVPFVRRGRHFESTNAPQWSSPAGCGPQQMYKRRRRSQENLSLNNEMMDDIAFETCNHEHVSSPSRNNRTVLVGPLDKVADNASGAGGAFPHHTGNFAGNRAEEGSTPKSLSVARTDTAGLEFEQNDSVMSKVPSQLAVDELVASNLNKDTESSTRETLSEDENQSANEEGVQCTSDKATADEYPTEYTLQSEVVPLDSNVSIPETTAFLLPQRSSAPTNSSTRETPESCIVSSPSSVVKDTDHNTPGSATNAMELSAGSSEREQAVTVDPEVPLEKELPVEVPVVSESSVQYDCSLNAEKLTEPTVGNIVTDTIRINNHVIASLERLNEVEAGFMIAKTSLSAQEDKLRQVENSSKSCRRLEVLCGIVYDLQRHIGSHSCGLNAFRKQDLLGKLDNYLESILIRNEQTLQEKVDALQAGLEHFLAVDIPFVDDRVAESKTEAVKLNGVSNSNSMPSLYTEVHDDRPDDANGTVWEDDDWFEEGAVDDPASESDEQEDVVAQVFSEKSVKFGGDFLAVKMEEGASSRWPRELPSFVWTLLARVISSDPQSYVMRVTLKRLLDEIAKGDSYYYLHPTNVSKDADVFSPLHSSPSSGCEFGCRGASALKWERKLVSQISSRMKSFDNVAYSLARSSGGKEVLNRKKMNSIIRKLHLVAMQLHSLVSHLYCVKGHVTCKEVDSLPVALNNSHFERKMGVYKSRLKLVVPHKYQQQTQQKQHSSNEPGEELLRDTYEFFPELLLCIDIWGYNYRESLVKQHNSNSLISGKLAGVGAISEAALFPLCYFRKVESLAFDFENDSNGLLHSICDELLNIVCLWNDFKWTDNLEAVALDRVVSFESDVTASILKILELYAHHLQALWSVRLLDEPDQLRSIHFTEFNAYYSDRSQRSLNTTACSQSRAPSVSENLGDGPNCDSRTVDQHVATEILEQRLAEEYWNRKVTALSIRNPGEDEMEVGSDSKRQLLSDEVICSWDQQALVSYLLRWSDVYAIRTEVNALSAVTNHMMKHEVQKFRFVGCDDTSVTSGSYVTKTMVDSSTRQLLAAVSRAQMLIQDALIGSEKLALHSASNQLPNEKKHVKQAELHGKLGNKTSSFSMEVAPSCPTSTCRNDAGAHSKDAVSETVCHAEAIALKDADSYDAIEDVNVGTGMTGEQPEVKGLIQLLAVTKQDIQKLCGHRPRSARMRAKVQMQSLQLARQTVEIFRNIRNIYGSQRR